MRITIGIIGGGNMGQAIASRICKKYKVLVCEKDSTKQDQLKRKLHLPVKDLDAVVCQSKIIILAVKPQDFDVVLAEVKGNITKNQLVISIAAGITTSYIEKSLGDEIRVVRTMPNMPAQIGEGITAVCRGKSATSQDVKLTAQIFTFIGKTVIVDENLIDAITAVSGSGPAYVFLVVECLLRAAQTLGLNESITQELVNTTVLGSVHLLNQSKEDAAQLRAKVTSKGGTTQAAMDVFFAHKIEEIFAEALQAARKRAEELAKK